MIRADIFDPSSFISAVTQFVDLIGRSTDSAVLTALGFALLLVGIGAISKLIVAKPESTSNWLKWTAIGSLVCGVLFAASGPGLALLRRPQIEVLPAQTSLDRLKRNDRVEWLIRLIAYDPTKDAQKNSLAIGKLKSLGPEEVEYTFVAPYDELKGYPVGEALRKSGSQVPAINNFRVSGIIFPVTDRIYPANARGLMQIIKSVEDTHPEIKNKLIDNQYFSQSEIDDLTPSPDREAPNTGRGTYAFEAWGSNYKKYCRISHKFRCDNSKENSQKKSYISRITTDWHPVGASIHHEPRASICDTGDSYCDKDNWNKIEKDISDKFGVRIFLIKNTKLDDLDRRYLIDFGDENQLIPEIGEPRQKK
ncbi:MAG TPA: hypothetical protein PKA55_09430 [Rhodoblastus sp.]|nr:hypothetical protein [Rhodoblastus sp.]